MQRRFNLDDDDAPLLQAAVGVHGLRGQRLEGGGMRRNRTISTASLDPNENPVTGLERVSSYNSLHALARRQAREERLRQEGHRMPHRNPEHEEHLLSAQYESLDYEIVENELYREQEQHAEHQNELLSQSIQRWQVCFLIGVITAIIAVFIDIMVYYSSQIKFHLIITSLINLCDDKELMTQGGGCMWMVLSSWATYNLCLVAIAACLVLFVSPVAAGSGIPQIKCFLNGIQIPGVVRLKTLVAKAVGVACSVAGGLAAGKEGPMIHSGAVVAAGISQGRCISLPFDFGLFNYFRNDREKRDFVSAGAAAGVAAAFGAPIGGVLYSLEEGASFWNQSLTWRMFFSAMISSFTVNCLLSVFYGKGGFLSWTGLANFGVFEDNSYNVWEIPFFLVIGAIGGLSGALFNYLNTHLSKFRKKFITNRFQKLFECLLVAAASAFIGFTTIFIIDDCQPLGVNPNLTDVTRLWCPKGKYSAVANLFFANPEESVKNLFHSPINSFRAGTLAIFAVEYYFLTLWTYGLSVPSGVFIPALLTGAAWGRLFGITVEYMFPNVTGIDPGKYALAGAAAQLGGVVRMTISLTAIIVEATKDITFGLPIMLVLMTTKWVGDIFNEGLYDAHIDLAEVPILGWHPPKLSRNILARRVMRKDVVAMERRERVGRVLQVLRETRHHGFPIVDRIDPALPGSQYPEYGHLKGLILRKQLITLISKRAFSIDREGHQMVDDAGIVTLADFQDLYPRYDQCALNLEDKLHHSDLNCWIDLQPYIHPTPHRVPLNASLQSIYHLFRGLGLRYLAVVDDENRLRGMITRKDVARFKERRHKNKYLVTEVYIANYN
ncbi:hypothetical protein QR680_019056 [Steinernema hermaphroditum]|uniref:Chloride channel protein n=1 Tax=Steinernema hermaphroditum TaxID=289476 RepID=A0AA39LRZ2_9BILA|nr:hypothetical protein QR680_019056 [Steinernema hermaphroditum]